ncbi:uncharacterized protein LOC120277049 [Dioscorea cayenensis subsp. rotundata]|uniref:Uncharacterized protein LOC120277049 n=1 Tax=Dioscorea cayennensis subsp. rotundata TaxID=55577 RepID=A0AB40CIN0_DIOCR|nr:uncharacterized protein LOC120277049 [Dioscorea cayenensis subsp. rotundata]
MTCKRCGGAGHMASGCRVELLSPPRHRRARPPTKARNSDKVVRSATSQAPFDRMVANCLHPQKVNLLLSLTQETTKLRKDLAKIIVIEIISGQTSDEILLEFLPGVLNTPRVDAVYEFRGNSFLATLCREEEAIKASKVPELSLPSKMGPCVISISPWTVEVGFVGSASGKGQVLLIWNLPLHAWTWPVLVEILKPIGELVTIPQLSKPHKSFLSVFVRCHQRTSLPFEVSLSFGMRRFIVLITDNWLPFPTFRNDLEKFCYSSASLECEIDSEAPRGPRFTHEVPREANGKDTKGAQVTGKDQGNREQQWRPRSIAAENRPVSAAPGVHRSLEDRTCLVSSVPDTCPVRASPGVLNPSTASAEVNRTSGVRREGGAAPDLSRTAGQLPPDARWGFSEMTDGPTSLHGSACDLSESSLAVGSGLDKDVSVARNNVVVPDKRFRPHHRPTSVTR